MDDAVTGDAASSDVPPDALVAELVDVTMSVWSSFTGTTPERADLMAAGPCATVTCMVGIGGAFEGGVVLTSSRALAEEVTNSLFGTTDVGAELVHDAVGELTNMLAGNLKVLLPGPSHLTLPVVTSGNEYTMTSPHSTQLAGASFVLHEKVFTVELVQSSTLPRTVDRSAPDGGG